MELKYQRGSAINSSLSFTSATLLYEPLAAVDGERAVHNVESSTCIVYVTFVFINFMKAVNGNGTQFCN